jgi:hypothetical protein
MLGRRKYLVNFHFSLKVYLDIARRSTMPKQLFLRKRMQNKKMKTPIFLLILMLSLFVLRVHPGASYVIDGKINDWGIDLSASGADLKGYLDTHLPSGGRDIDYITEDNAGNIPGWQFVGPGYTYNGNYFDAEAIYFDNDGYNAYIAIVQGLPIAGGTAPGNPWFNPGDIAIDVPGGGFYEYGISIANGNLYTVSSWKNVYYSAYSSSNPWQIASGTAIGPVDFVYSFSQNTHYVLEAAIPLSYLGLSTDHNSSITIHWTQECGNDSLTLNADVNSAPEPATMLLLGSGLIGLGGFMRKRFRK